MTISSLFSRGITLEDRMIATHGRPAGFDYMRIILAFGVVVWHSNLLCYGENAEYGFIHDMLEPFARMIVPMFFALSGFLVAGSFERSKTLVTFLGLRVYRIVPALAMEVFLSALILGPVFTSLPLENYFLDQRFFAYFLNILGEIHYVLPGVFEDNPFPNIVNGQLWTVPYELICYIVLSLFAVLGIFAKRHWLFVMIVVYYIGQIGNSILRPHDHVMGPAGSTTVMCFIAGLLIYRYREKLLWDKKIAALMLMLSLYLLCIPNGVRFCALPLSYLTIYLGLMNPGRNKIVLSGDYSYGVYLYGFPIQQTFVALSPAFHVWYWNLAVTIPSVLAMAVFSWWLVEKPILEKRHLLKDLESRYLAWPIAQKLRSFLERTRERIWSLPVLRVYENGNHILK